MITLIVCDKCDIGLEVNVSFITELTFRCRRFGCGGMARIFVGR